MIDREALERAASSWAPLVPEPEHEAEAARYWRFMEQVGRTFAWTLRAGVGVFLTDPAE